MNNSDPSFAFVYLYKLYEAVSLSFFSLFLPFPVFIILCHFYDGLVCGYIFLL